MAGGQCVYVGLATQGAIGGSDHEILALERDRPVPKASNVMARHAAEAFCRHKRRHHHHPDRLIAMRVDYDRREIGFT